jgi:hypothetical protein
MGVGGGGGEGLFHVSTAICFRCVGIRYFFTVITTTTTPIHDLTIAHLHHSTTHYPPPRTTPKTKAAIANAPLHYRWTRPFTDEVYVQMWIQICRHIV